MPERKRTNAEDQVQSGAWAERAFLFCSSEPSGKCMGDSSGRWLSCRAGESEAEFGGCSSQLSDKDSAKGEDRYCRRHGQKAQDACAAHWDTA